VEGAGIGGVVILYSSGSMGIGEELDFLYLGGYIAGISGRRGLYGQEVGVECIRAS
jgi:hypothetical protein